VEEAAGAAGPRTLPSAVLRSPARPIGEVDARAARSAPTGVGELDRVLGGGVVPGAVVLLAGEPGVGKSTLLLDVAARVAASGGRVLYVSGEESAAQVRSRADRIGAIHPGLLLAAETDLAQVLAQVDAAAPDLLLVDSVQTIASAAVEGSAGGIGQVREVASALIATAKGRGLPVLLVGHVTKDGAIAGPRLLEHLVDVVCQFEGDRHTRLRFVRAVKNRYGPTDEVGCFDLSGDGIVSLADPSGLFLSGTGARTPGTCVTVTLEGRRPMPTEVQALVTRTSLGTPRRTSAGVDSARVAMVLAVLQARLGLDAQAHDVYVATVGGARAVEPAADLAIALALASARQDAALAPGLVAIGEVGLAGEVRPTTGVQRRLAEAARLGFRRAVVPRSRGGEAIRPPDGLDVVEVEHLAAALAAAHDLGDPPAEVNRSEAAAIAGRL
jgi:DNA repair protein RadA/Sms